MHIALAVKLGATAVILVVFLACGLGPVLAGDISEAWNTTLLAAVGIAGFATIFFHLFRLLAKRAPAARSGDDG